MTERHAIADLVSFAAALFERAGMEPEKAQTTAALLVQADCMGHTTHGLALAPAYLRDLEAGKLRGVGDPEVVSDRPGAVLWDGGYLPGLWLTARAVDLGLARVRQQGVVVVSIRRSHHIGCLAVFLARATSAGCLAIVSCSDPSVASVAPYGGQTAVYTPNPIAIGIPTDSDPILIDISASVTTNGYTGRLHREGKKLEHDWLLDGAGNPSNDPAVLFTDPPGTILPTGGLDHGHKGYGLALTVEALTQALSGHGRADAPSQWGASTYVQIVDPEAFGGSVAFLRQSSWLAAACRASLPRPGMPPVRLPGEGAAVKARAAAKDGVALYPAILDGLSPWAEKFGVTPPKANS